MEQSQRTSDETIHAWMEAHAAGVREAWLLEALNRLAWEAFHDPWEVFRPLRKARLPLDASFTKITPPDSMRKGHLPLSEPGETGEKEAEHDL